jgi:hypothetical protein
LFCVQKNNSLLLCSHCIGCPPWLCWPCHLLHKLSLKQTNHT